ncbi:type IV pili methyl-accepting chemotaxis transducer N-terminal domain-containing protein [Pseudoduganella chitinolytica]|uniref:Sensor protein n=1 Tax=Pseudoduganella chitinolytica TaxID=34070 RepID=A0ABY8BI91_9BURK|nr:type IV pili methyl-accepting chemotaxis transducer N-terminal domain-containing protein [Pseudoduganella chitinolytica]WEF34387.1 type IV pili methyl-accepting chemotaxis transducer N-terminal domain-containing protein [Pseudoduganella chitinolytica]
MNSQTSTAAAPRTTSALLRVAQDPAWRKLSTKIVGSLLGFLIVALTVIGATLYLSWQLEGSAAAINVTGSLRMTSFRLSLAVSGMAEPARREASVLEARQQMAVLDDTLAQLRHGDPQRPLLLPPAPAIRQTFERVTEHWATRLRPETLALLAQPDIEPAQAWSFQRDAEVFVTDVARLVQQIEQDSETRTFWLRGSQLLLLALATAGTVSIIYLLFNLIIAPVTSLQGGMARMRERDFEVRLPSDRSDEFGELAQGFNQMADRLQGVYANLEQLVATKTAALAAQNQELALLYDSAAFLQRPQPTEEMCQGFLRRLSEYFGADGGSVRILEPGRGNLHMLVHHGLSPQLVEAEHCMKVGDCLCGEAVEKKITIVHDLRQMPRGAELECRREGYETVSMFHIYAHQQHLGMFNLHFRRVRTFNAQEKALLETLGQLLGTAIENLRLGAREREMAISEERNLVAQGLHDSIAQGVNFLNLQVQMLEQSVRAGKLDEVSDIVPALRAGVQESYEDVRELLLNFRTRLVEDSLVTSLQTTIDKFERQAGIEVTLEADLDGAPFAREQQLQLLFIVQEALSNVRKHAGARHVQVTLSDAQDFTLSIKDDGQGFDVAALAQQGEHHVGIHIMRERAQRISATLEVQSAPGSGTTILLQLPRELRRAA